MRLVATPDAVVLPIGFRAGGSPVWPVAGGGRIEIVATDDDGPDDDLDDDLDDDRDDDRDDDEPDGGDDDPDSEGDDEGDDEGDEPDDGGDDEVARLLQDVQLALAEVRQRHAVLTRNSVQIPAALRLTPRQNQQVAEALSLPVDGTATDQQYQALVDALKMVSGQAKRYRELLRQNKIDGRTARRKPGAPSAPAATPAATETGPATGTGDSAPQDRGESTLKLALIRAAVESELRDRNWSGQDLNRVMRLIDKNTIDVDPDTGAVLGIQEQVDELQVEFPEWFKRRGAARPPSTRVADGMPKASAARTRRPTAGGGWAQTVARGLTR